jgi:hypothetical protein
MILGRFILQGNIELHSIKVDEFEGYYQINNRVLSTTRKDPGS